MLDARHALEEAPAGGDDQGIIGKLPLLGDNRASAILEADDGARAVIDAVFLQERLQGNDQIFTVAKTWRYPYQTGQIDEFRLRCDQRNEGFWRSAAQFAGSRQGGKAGAEDSDARCSVGHIFSIGCVR